MSFEVAAINLRHQVSVQKGLGFARLLFTVDITPQAIAAEDLTLFLYSFTGDLRMIPLGADGLLAHLYEPHVPSHIFTSNRPMSAQVTLAADLTAQTLERIAEIRDAGDLQLQVTLYALNVSPRYGVIPRSQQETITIPHSVWVTHLNTLGFQKVILVEIPIPHNDPASRWAKVTALLARAHELLLEGNPREAIGKSREMLDALQLEMGDPRKYSDLHDQNRNRSSRLSDLRIALRELSHHAHHIDAVSATFPEARRNAQSMIGLIAALLRESMASAPPQPTP